MSITCTRCGADSEPLPQAPMPTATGREILAHVCPSCWQEWLRTQVIYINEYRLNLIDPQVRAQLEREMRRFLNLPEAPAP